MIKILSKGQYYKKVGEVEKYIQRIVKLDNFEILIVAGDPLSSASEKRSLYFEYDDERGVMGNYVFVYIPVLHRILFPISPRNLFPHLDIEEIIDWIIIQDQELNGIDMDVVVDKNWELVNYKSLEDCQSEGIKVPVRYCCEESDIFPTCFDRTVVKLPYEGRYIILDKITGRKFRIWIRFSDLSDFSYTDILTKIEETVDKEFYEIILKTLIKKYNYECYYD